jgi:hypothetical protein
MSSAPANYNMRARRAIVGMATTTAGNFGMAVGVALLRFSGDTTRQESFHLTFTAFLGGAMMLLPVAGLLRTAVRVADGAKQEDRKGHYASLKVDDAADEAP